MLKKGKGEQYHLFYNIMTVENIKWKRGERTEMLVNKIKI